MVWFNYDWSKCSHLATDCKSSKWQLRWFKARHVSVLFSALPAPLYFSYSILIGITFAAMISLYCFMTWSFHSDILPWWCQECEARCGMTQCHWCRVLFSLISDSPAWIAGVFWGARKLIFHHQPLTARFEDGDCNMSHVHSVELLKSKASYHLLVSHMHCPEVWVRSGQIQKP